MRLDKRGYSGILLLAIVILGLIIIFGYIRHGRILPSTESPGSAGYNTYINSKYGFSVKYPSSLAVREFPDTKDGAGFRPAGMAEDPVNEVIVVSVLEKSGDLKDESLSEYARVAAVYEIQNYQKLNTYEAVKTPSGAVGYKTTWDVLPLATLDSTPSSETKVSLPITYFSLKEATSSSVVQITLNDVNYENQYTEIIDSYTP